MLTIAYRNFSGSPELKAMKTPLLTLMLLLLFRVLPAQTFEWVRGVEMNFEYNPDGLIYNVAASPDGTVWYGGLKNYIEHYNNALGDLILARYTADGLLLQEHMVSGSAVLNDIRAAGDGSVYLTGQFRSDITLWDGLVMPFTGPFINSFLIRMAADGTVLYAKNLSADFPDSEPSVLLPDGEELLLAHSEWIASYITRFDGSGNILGSIVQDEVGLISGLTLDADGNLYATGSCPHFGSSFNGVPHESPFSYSIYLVKYTQAEAPEWVRFVEDISCTHPVIASMADGNIAWAGDLFITAVFDTITLNGPSWVNDFFVVAMNPEGHALWGYELPEAMSGDAHPGKIKPLCTLPDNSIVVSGVMRGSVNWGNGVVTSIPGLANNLMVLSLSGEGLPQWVKTGNGEAYSTALAVEKDAENNLFVAATGHDTVVYDTCSYTSESFYFPHLVKLQSGLITSVPEVEQIRQPELYPNPASGSVTLHAGSEIREAALLDLSGRLIQVIKPFAETAAFDLAGIPAGNYLIRVVTSDGVDFRKMVVVR